MRPEPYEHLRNDETFDRLDGLAAMGDPATVALAWLLGDPRVTAIVVGPRRPAHLEPALAALENPLAAAEREQLSSIFSP
jgi:NDP-hexose 2,3-enoyl reductase